MWDRRPKHAILEYNYLLAWSQSLLITSAWDDSGTCYPICKYLLTSDVAITSNFVATVSFPRTLPILICKIFIAGIPKARKTKMVRYLLTWSRINTKKNSVEFFYFYRHILLHSVPIILISNFTIYSSLTCHICVYLASITPPSS